MASASTVVGTDLIATMPCPVNGGLVVVKGFVVGIAPSGLSAQGPLRGQVVCPLPGAQVPGSVITVKVGGL